MLCSWQAASEDDALTTLSFFVGHLVQCRHYNGNFFFFSSSITHYNNHVIIDNGSNEATELENMHSSDENRAVDSKQSL